MNGWHKTESTAYAAGQTCHHKACQCGFCRRGRSPLNIEVDLATRYWAESYAPNDAYAEHGSPFEAEVVSPFDGQHHLLGVRGTPKAVGLAAGYGEVEDVDDWQGSTDSSRPHTGHSQTPQMTPTLPATYSPPARAPLRTFAVTPILESPTVSSYSGSPTMHSTAEYDEMHLPVTIEDGYSPRPSARRTQSYQYPPSEPFVAYGSSWSQAYSKPASYPSTPAISTSMIYSPTLEARVAPSMLTSVFDRPAPVSARTSRAATPVASGSASGLGITEEGEDVGSADDAQSPDFADAPSPSPTPADESSANEPPPFPSPPPAAIAVEELSSSRRKRRKPAARNIKNAHSDSEDEDEDGARPSKHGKRMQIACHSCRQRKSKCDGGHPCNKCAGSKTECTYEDKPRRRGPGRKKLAEMAALRERQRTEQAAAAMVQLPVPRHLGALSQQASTSSVVSDQDATAPAYER